MLRTLLDFFCSRPFAEGEKPLSKMIALGNALVWGVVTFCIGLALTGNYAVIGEHAEAVALFTGALPGGHEAYPVLWGLKSLFLGASPSIYAVNVFGAALMGALMMVTFGLVRFWVIDAADEDKVVKWARLTALLTANLTCLLILTSLPGLYLVSGFTTTAWAFLWLPLCGWLQSRYALGGGHRRDMIVFGLVLGIGVIESPWVLAFLPIFFLRAVVLEWRLWDHNVKNLPMWFITTVVGALVMLCINAVRMTGTLTIATVWETEVSVLLNHIGVLMGLISARWILDLGLGIGWALMAWITARRLLNNDRKWGLLVTALAMTVVGILLTWMAQLSPTRSWIHLGMMPIATVWVTAVAMAMLTAGWATQLLAKNPNIDEELDRHHTPARVTALRVTAILVFPLCVVAVVASAIRHGKHFAMTDRELPSRFAQTIVDRIRPNTAEATAAHPYVLGEYWIDTQLLLAAYRSQVPMTLISLNMANNWHYIRSVKEQMQNDPLLESADRLRLVHLVDYSFPVFVQDFYASQANVADISVIFARPNVWHAAHLHPMAYGPVYVGKADPQAPLGDEVAQMKAFYEQWKGVCTDANATEWWNLSARTAQNIRHHLAFMVNNLGTWLDDHNQLEAAGEHYLLASQIEKENISALLNLYDICVRRGQLADRRAEVQKAFEDLIARGMKNPRKYNLTGVGQYYGYIRNYGLFVQMGLEWAADAAPESILAGLRNAQVGLAPNDPRAAALHAVTAAVYEMQGQTARSVAGYLAAVEADPKNVEAMRGLARLAMQDGDVAEAGQWISKAEAAGADAGSMELDRGAYLMARGDFEGANKAISSFTTKNPESVIGWSMLGMLRVEEGNLTDASGFILENIRRRARGKEIYFYHTLQARITQEQALNLEKAALEAEEAGRSASAQMYLTDAKAKWEEARKQYSRAYAIRPNVRGILEILLNIDRRLEDKAAAEVSALTILRSVPTHGYANFIVGSQRLEDGHIDAALTYLKAAVEGNAEPTVDLLNNYADALSRTPNTVLAKDVAIRAVRLAPRSYAVWGTLGLALARNKNISEATSALAKARTLPGGNDPHLELVEFWIQIAKQDKAAAEKALAAFKTGMEQERRKLTALDEYDIKEAETALGK